MSLLDEQGYTTTVRSALGGGWEVLVVGHGETWTGRGSTEFAAREAVLRQMFPSAVAWALAHRLSRKPVVAPAIPPPPQTSLHERLAAVGVRRR